MIGSKEKKKKVDSPHGWMFFSSNPEPPSQKHYSLPDNASFIPPNTHCFPQASTECGAVREGVLEGVKKCGFDHLSTCFRLSKMLPNLKPQTTLWNETVSS